MEEREVAKTTEKMLRDKIKDLEANLSDQNSLAKEISQKAKKEYLELKESLEKLKLNREEDIKNLSEKFKSKITSLENNNSKLLSEIKGLKKDLENESNNKQLYSLS